MNPDEKVVYTSCFFARLGHPDPCRQRDDGLPDRAHLVPQARIRAAAASRGWSPSKTGDAIWDRRCFVLACRHHHGLLDSKAIRLDPEQYPPSFHEWAEEYGFAWIDHRTGWVAVADHPEEAA